MFFSRSKPQSIVHDCADPHHRDAVARAPLHHVFHRPLSAPYPEDTNVAFFAMGCFWGAERLFWRLGDQKIWVTAVGYAGGSTPHPSYETVCSGRTGHAEVVAIVYRPEQIAYKTLLEMFWENHDPTQGMRQGGDVGSQYRSAIYVQSQDDLDEAQESRDLYAKALQARGFGAITTEIAQTSEFYFAEDYHQQYLSKNPHGYCGLGGTGVSCPIS